MGEMFKKKKKLASGGPGDTPPDDALPGSVMVSYGPYVENLPVAGMTVEQVKNRYGDRFDIDPDSVAVVGGDIVPLDHVLETNEVLTFTRQVGSKG